MPGSTSRDPLDSVGVMDTVWHADRRERTRTGRLIDAAKEHGDDSAVALLAQQAAIWVGDRGLPRDAVVIPVPPSPDRSNRLVPAVAAAVAHALDCPHGAALERRAATPRLRDLDPADRPAAALAADYHVVGTLPDDVVLVDDVVLTATTLQHLAALLKANGARRVHAIVLARSRRA